MSVESSNLRDELRVIGTLLANKDKNFVQRILHPDKFPTIDLGDGNIGTHLMAWGEADGKYRVFPTIVFDGKSLKKYEMNDAFKITSENGDYIDFETPEEAEWFSKNYKLFWGERPK